MDSFASILIFSPHHTYASRRRTSLSASPVLGQALPSACSNYPPVSLPHSNDQSQYRNINLLSIAYDHLVLGLGPDLPWVDEPSPGNLRLSMGRILTFLSLLMPAFSLLCSPPLLSVRLLPAYDAPLPIAYAIP